MPWVAAAHSQMNLTVIFKWLQNETTGMHKCSALIRVVNVSQGDGKVAEEYSGICFKGN